MKYTKVCKICMLTACTALTVLTAVLSSTVCGEENGEPVESADDIPKTVESLDMLRSIRYESAGYLAGSVSLTVDFSSFTADIAYSDSSEGDLGDPTAQYTASFTEEQAQAFLQTANVCGMFGWDELYDDEDIEDGSWDSLEIEFADGSVQSVFCSNANPPDFDTVRDALLALADERPRAS